MGTHYRFCILLEILIQLILPKCPSPSVTFHPQLTAHCPSSPQQDSPPSKLDMIRDMILSKSLTTSQMAEAAECSTRSIINIRNNLRHFGSVRAPFTRVGRRRSITPLVLEVLCDHLLEKPGLYVEEMAVFLGDEFQVLVTNSCLKRALASIGWSKNVARQRANEQNADLRDLYLHNLSDLIVFVFMCSDLSEE